MNKIKLLGIFIAIVLILILPIIQQEDQDLKQRTVTRVIDGDTLVVEGGNRVRLLGIDTQEEGERCYKEAKERMEELVLKEEIKLQREGEDKYGRTLGYIFLDGVLINEQIVEEGLAVAYMYEEAVDFKDEIQNAEQIAKKEKRGCEWSELYAT